MVQISLLAIAILLLALTIFVWRAKPDALTHRWFAIFTLAVANWTIGIVGLQSESHLDIWGRFTFASAALIPAASLTFIYHYPAQSGWPTSVLVRGVLWAAGIISVVSISTPLLVVDNLITHEGLKRTTGPLYPIFATYFLIAWASTLAVLATKWIRARGVARARLQFVGTAFAISGAGAITANLAFPVLTGKSTYSWFGPYFGLILTALVAHAIIRHRLMDLRLVVHRGLTFAIAMLLSLCPVAVALAFYWPTLVAHFGPDELIFLLGPSLVGTLFVPPTPDIARRRLDRYVYRTRANYQRTVREASRMLTRVLDLKRLLPFISKTVVEATSVEGVAIYLRDEDGFRRAMAQRRNEASEFEAPATAPASVIAALTRVQEALVADEVARQIVTDADRMLSDDLAVTNWALLLPVISDDGLIAFIAVGTLPEIELPGAERTRPAMCTTSPLRDPDGIVLGAVAVFSDLTPLKELEIERRRAERLAYFEVLASGIAHEIKNPLVAIKTFTQLLPRRAREPQFVDEFGRIVGREIHRMERVVDRLRTLAHPGRRPEYAVDVRAPLTEALEFMQATFDEKSVTIDASLGDTPCRVLGDHQNLEQLFLNLLMNAHEATPPGGTLTIAVTREAEHVTVSVGDTGPGIAPELLEKIFEPFFTTKQRGSGLGLAISAGVAQAHGARLRAANHPGGGAIFSVQFPLAPVTAPVIA